MPWLLKPSCRLKHPISGRIIRCYPRHQLLYKVRLCIIYKDDVQDFFCLHRTVYSPSSSFPIRQKQGFKTKKAIV